MVAVLGNATWRFSMNLVNLTPHPIVLACEDGSRVTVAASGTVARVSSTPGALERVEGIPVPVAASTVFGEVEGLPAPAEGEYYWIDLIGCAVRGQNDAALGSVSALDDHGAHPILIVVDGERERLVPFVGDYIVAVDLDARLIRVDWHADW